MGESRSVPIPHSATPQRVIAYIDGFNLYFGMREAFGGRYYWLDLPAMCRSLLKTTQTLVATKYFTARVSEPAGKVKRQGTYIEAVQTLGGLTVYEGRYVGDIAHCARCGAMVFIHNEKMTDVNIAVEITKDAHADRFDTALLVTGDSDQTPTIRMVKEVFPTKRVVCAFPPKRISKELRAAAHGYVHITGGHLAAAQLPVEVTKVGGVVLRRPPEWV